MQDQHQHHHRVLLCPHLLSTLLPKEGAANTTTQLLPTTATNNNSILLLWVSSSSSSTVQRCLLFFFFLFLFLLGVVAADDLTHLYYHWFLPKLTYPPNQKSLFLVQPFSFSLSLHFLTHGISNPRTCCQWFFVAPLSPGLCFRFFSFKFWFWVHGVGWDRDLSTVC